MKLLFFYFFILFTTTTQFTYGQLAPLLDFDELQQAIESDNKSLNHKIDSLLTSYHVDNDLSQNTINPQIKKNKTLGKYISVATWNIEKSLNVLELVKILKSKSPEDFFDKSKAKHYQEAIRQLNRFKNADVIFFQEMDYGVNRSRYLFAAQELAKALNMNFTYAPNQLEIDPYLLQTNLTTSGIAEHKKRYKGMFGIAILSRFKISNIKSIPFKNQAYDWFEQEKAYTPKDVVEKIRVYGAEKVFGIHIKREIKRGKRGFLRVDIDIPDIPEGKITLVNVHLEIKTYPKGRRTQMQEVLNYIQDIKNPVVMAGDFNSTNGDAQYQSTYRLTKKMLTNPSTYISLLTHAVASPVVSTINSTRRVVNVLRNFKNPTALHIPVILPNKSRAMFKDIFEFKFSDGYVFDLRGSRHRSIGRSGHLSNSNQKAGAFGFKATFEVPQSRLIFGIEKLDWMFVKAYSQTSKLHKDSSDQPYRMAPHFGETLTSFNSLVRTGKISDHNPMIVDLPLFEPDYLNKIENEYIEKMRKRKKRRRLHKKRR